MAVSWTQTIDNVFTTTWAYRKGKAVEQAFQNTPLAFYLSQSGRVDKISGYRRIEIPLDYGSTSSPAWLAKGDTMTETDNEFLTMAYEDWKYAAINVVRYWQDDQKNKGRAQIVNYVEAKLNSAERALWEEFERVLFADGTGQNEPNGLQNIIAQDPTTGTLHGIDRATYTWFRNKTKQASGAFPVYGIQDMRNMYNTLLTYKGVSPRDYVIVTDQTTFEAYEDELLEIKRIVDAKLADAGFENYVFKGRPFLWSPQAPSAKIYFLNTAHVKLVIDQDEFLDMTEWKPVHNRPKDRFAQITAVLNMVTDRPIVSGVIHSITY